MCGKEEIQMKKGIGKENSHKGTGTKEQSYTQQSEMHNKGKDKIKIKNNIKILNILFKKI